MLRASEWVVISQKAQENSIVKVAVKYRCIGIGFRKSKF